jgi:hypothetical protein
MHTDLYVHKTSCDVFKQDECGTSNRYDCFSNKSRLLEILNKNNMIKIVKFALLAMATGIVLNSGQAQTTYNNDLLIGFTKQSGNDLIYDLGAASSLTNGQTWNLVSLLSGYTLSTVNWGVIGDKQVSGLRYAWMTTDGTFLPIPVPSTSAWGKLNTATSSIYQNMSAAGAGQYVSIASSDDNSWNSQTINPSLTTQYANVQGNPNVVGLTSDSYYSMIATNQPPQLAGKFTLAANGVVTFNTVANTPPAPTIVSITRVGTATTVFFTTTNTYTYGLCFTNSSGLATSVTNWPKSVTTVTGPGNGIGATNSIVDSTTDATRLYRVGAH